MLPKKQYRMAVNIIGAIAFTLVLFGMVVSSIGLMSFTDAFQQEYSTSTFHMAQTAAVLVNGDHLASYVSGEYAEEYAQTKARLDVYCGKMNVSLIYVIIPDTSDYGRFVSVFNLVNNSVDNTEYTPWELGHQRDTTNAEYRQKYEALYRKEAAYETIYRTYPTDGQHPHVTTLVPVKDSTDYVVGILCIQRPARELNDARRPFLVRIAISTFLMAALAGGFIAVFLNKQVVGPVKRVSDEATRFAKENTKEEPLGTISRIEEISNLAASIDKMETDMVHYVTNLTTLTAERERIGTELQLATSIQESMLPHTFPPFPNRNEFDLYASMDPAKEVGGDFYDYFLIDEDHLCLVIADVSGKGVPAALFMMASKIILQSCARLGRSASEILYRTNEAICDSNQVQMFVTVWVGILEISTGKITAANAGHEYPVIRQPDGAYELLKDRHGFVVGGMEGVRYREYELTLQPGARLFLYTDGVPEATDAEGNMFGTDRMLQALNREPQAHPQQVLKNVRAAVDGFVLDAEQFDDLTMLCLEYNGKQPDGAE
ncbi:MAG: serine/threonine-protein phosphatase [Clostridia bacterium]|nr:serine/threonine-protein phosphatase [Clostridia bacterium]